MADANVKARAIAEALPARIVGVHGVREVDESRGHVLRGAPAPGGSLLKSRSVGLGFALGQRRSVTVSIAASYRIAPTG